MTTPSSPTITSTSSTVTTPIVEGRFENSLQQLLSPHTDAARAITQAKVFFINLLDSIKSPTAYGGHRQLITNVLNSQLSFIQLLMKYAFITRDDTGVILTTKSTTGGKPSVGYRGKLTHALTLLCAIDHSLNRLNHARTESQQSQDHQTQSRSSATGSNMVAVDPISFQRVFIPVFSEIALQLVISSRELQEQDQIKQLQQHQSQSQLLDQSSSSPNIVRRKALSSYKPPSTIEKSSMDFSNYSFAKQRCMLVVFLLSFLPSDPNFAPYYDSLFNDPMGLSTIKRLFVILKQIIQLNDSQVNGTEKSSIPRNIVDIVIQRLQVLVQCVFTHYLNRMTSPIEDLVNDQDEQFKHEIQSLAKDFLPFILQSKQYDMLTLFIHQTSCHNVFLPIIVKYIEELLTIPLKNIAAIGPSSPSSSGSSGGNSSNSGNSSSNTTHGSSIPGGDSMDYGVSIMIKALITSDNHHLMYNWTKDRASTIKLLDLIAKRWLTISEESLIMSTTTSTPHATVVSCAFTLAVYEEILMELSKQYPKLCLHVFGMTNIITQQESSYLIKSVFITVKEDTFHRGLRIIQIIKNLMISGVTCNSNDPNDDYNSSITDIIDHNEEKIITINQEKLIEIIIICLFDLLSIALITSSKALTTTTTSTTGNSPQSSNKIQSRKSYTTMQMNTNKHGYYTVIIDILQAIVTLQKLLFSQDIVMNKMVIVLQHHEDDVQQVLSRANTITVSGLDGSISEKIQSLLYAIEEYATTAPVIESQVSAMSTPIHYDIRHDLPGIPPDNNEEVDGLIPIGVNAFVCHDPNTIDPLVSIFMQSLPDLRALFVKEPEERQIEVTSEGDVIDKENIAETLAAATTNSEGRSTMVSGSPIMLKSQLDLSRKESSTSMSLMRPTVILCRLTGFIIKQGSIFPSWKRRYFILDNRSLIYYASMEDANQNKPLSSPFIFFTGEDATTISDKGNGSLSLTLRNHGTNSHQSRKKLPLKFDSQEEKAMWKAAFLEHCTSDEMLSSKSSKPRKK